MCVVEWFAFFFFQAEDGIRDKLVTGVQTCALPISRRTLRARDPRARDALPVRDPPEGLWSGSPYAAPCSRRLRRARPRYRCASGRIDDHEGPAAAPRADRRRHRRMVVGTAMNEIRLVL